MLRECFCEKLIIKSYLMIIEGIFKEMVNIVRLEEDMAHYTLKSMEYSCLLTGYVLAASMIRSATRLSTIAFEAFEKASQ